MASDLASWGSNSMVSMQASQLSTEEKKPYSELETSFFSKKRKLREDDHHSEGKCCNLKTKLTKFQEDDKPKEEDIELNLSTTPPLPLDWQRCLDIKSGKIHFYNTRTHKRTSEDPRMIINRHSDLITPSPPPNLDLELNLSCRPLCRSSVDVGEKNKKKNISAGCTTPTSEAKRQEEEEMIATVCMRCHMLVIISKATMTCPSCKFVHPPESGNSSSTAALVRPSLKLMC